MASNEAFINFQSYLKNITHLEKVAGLAQWDQEVLMPAKGAADRAGLMAFLSSEHHRFWTSGKVEEWLIHCRDQSELTPGQKRNLDEIEKDLNKIKKLPEEFVSRMSQACSEAYQAWMKARHEEDFSVFAPHLQKIIDLNLEKAEYVGYKEHPYDALLDDYEPGLTLKEVESVLGSAKKRLTGIIDQINNQQQVDDNFLRQHFDLEEQKNLSKMVAANLGFDFQSGRLDVSEHPFTVSLSPKDVRITTRFQENDLAESLWSTIHETGHALYEQGLLAENYGLPSGEAISLGIHESQSRLWENHVGKSLPFIQGYLPVMKQYFSEQLGKIDEFEFYKGLNKVQPSLIRTSADEITYHLHILIRFELEKSLLDNSLPVQDLPEAWNEKYRNYLGVEVPSLKEGVLQDVHWSHGAIGYFPTYSIGSFYAAQFFHHARKAIPKLNEQLKQREFKPLLDWLRENIHQQGRLFNSREICEKVTGEPLNFEYFNHYALEKYQLIYNLG